jgi:hypothetical protein
MFVLPHNAKKVEPEGATVDFYEFQMNDNEYLYFDSSATTPPHPMVNAMLGLEMLTQKQRLIMINHQVPMALFNKIQHAYDYDIEPLSNGNVKIEFIQKEAMN